MSHFAKIENDIVTQVIVVDDQYESDGQNWINNELGLEGEWIQTSYNNRIRGNFAGEGYSYDRENDVFIPIQPYPSWVLDTDIWNWVSPIPYPSDGKTYIWNEDELNWSEL